MALFKITRGAEEDLPSSYHDGYAYFCTDTGSFYIDYKENESSTDIKRMKITAGKADRLTSSTQVGSVIEPVYFSTNGVPIKCTYKLQADVPSNAIFTDKTVEHKSTTSSSTIPILMAHSSSPTSGAVGHVNYASGITITPSSKTITATTFSGNATSANKLVDSVDVGSTTKPVYFENGLPKEVTYGLNATVPSDAKFTDTTYTISTGTDNGEIKVTPSNGSAYDVPVKGLGSAAYTNTTAYDAAGTATSKANTAESNAKAYADTLTITANEQADPNGIITLEGTNGTLGVTYKATHAKSGATANSYGDSSNQTPAYGGTFKVPYITVNDTGHITGISTHTVKIPASDNTNTVADVYCSTAAATAAKTASATGYVLRAKDIFNIRFANSNTAQSALTLNINGKGAKTIYINGVASSSSNYTLPAGSYVCYYDGTYYHIYTNGDFKANLHGNADTSSKWAAEKTITFTGDVTGSVSFDGSNNKSVTLTVADDSHNHTTAKIDGLDATISSINSELDGSIKSLSVSGKVITYTKNDGTTGTITTQDTNTDTKVTQNAVITTAKNYPVILGYSDATTAVTNVVNKASTLTYNPSTQILTAPTFKGNLDGIAETAEQANEAGKATNDGNGRNIVSTYETKTDASAKLTEAKEYTDTQIGLLINDSDPTTLNSIYDLGEAIKDNQDAIEALNSIAAGKADATTVNNHINNKSNPHGVTYAQTGAAPTSHASDKTTYGAGTSANYGHVKLSDSINSSSSTSGGIAATPAAVKTAYDLASNIKTNFDAHTHTVSHTPAGTVSKPTFTGSAVTSGANTGTAFSAAPSGHKHEFTPTGTVTKPTFTGSAVTSGKNSGTGVSAGSGTHTHTFLPTGTISTPTFTGTNKNTSAHTSTYTTTVAPNEHTHSFTPAGTVSAPTFTGSTGTTGENNDDAFSAAPGGHKHSVTAAGTVSTPTFTGSSVASGNNTTITGPTLSASIANKCFTITLSAGSYTHTHNVVASGTISTPTFTGIAVTSEANNGTNGSVSLDGHKHSFTPSGTISAPTFTGSAGTSGKNSGTGVSVSKSTHVHPFTPVGTISQPTFTGSEELVTGGPSATVTAAPNEHTHSVTASGSVSQPTFTGTKGTTDVNDGTNGSVAPSGHKHNVTAAGTISQPTFTGTAATLTTSTPTDD